MFFIDALLRHNIFPLQHWVQRRGALLEALYRISEGFFFSPHHLIMAALLYFEEKVHQKKLLRADAIPLLFPRLLCQILEHLGYPTEPQLERKWICREIFTLDKWTNMTAYRAEPGAPVGVEQPEEPQPIETPADTRAPAPAVPYADPTTPQPSPVFFSYITTLLFSRTEDYHIHFRVQSSMSHFVDIDHFTEHSYSGDGSPSCSSGANYCYSDSAYCHSEVDLEPSGYSISSSAPDACPLRAHRADSRRHTDIHLIHYLHIISTHLLDHFHSLLYEFSLCIFLL